MLVSSAIKCYWFNHRLTGADALTIPAKRHAEAYELLSKMSFKKPDNIVEGFLDESGEFYTRLQAMKVALESGQLAQPTNSALLYSEDIWPEDNAE